MHTRLASIASARARPTTADTARRTRLQHQRVNAETRSQNLRARPDSIACTVHAALAGAPSWASCATPLARPPLAPLPTPMPRRFPLLVRDSLVCEPR